MSAKALFKQISEHRAKMSSPHFVLSAENPKHSDKNEIRLGHSEVLGHLQKAGYDAHEIQHHNGKSEKGIIVYGVTKEHAEKLHSLAARLGQDSSIYSTGEEHEMRFHHGDLSGKKFNGKGTSWHKQKPEGSHISLPGGSHHFSHNFDFEAGAK